MRSGGGLTLPHFSTLCDTEAMLDPGCLFPTTCCPLGQMRKTSGLLHARRRRRVPRRSGLYALHRRPPIDARCAKSQGCAIVYGDFSRRCRQDRPVQRSDVSRFPYPMSCRKWYYSRVGTQDFPIRKFLASAYHGIENELF